MSRADSPVRESETLTLRAAKSADRRRVEELLQSSRLPIDGVADAFENFIIAESHGHVVGAIGLEMYGRAALLRSAVVAEQTRGSGVGAELVGAILRRAGELGVEEVFLLTTTAENYFPRFGFRRVTRADVPDSVKRSAEFTGACPDTAIVMRRTLTASGLV